MKLNWGKLGEEVLFAALAAAAGALVRELAGIATQPAQAKPKPQPSPPKM